MKRIKCLYFLLIVTNMYINASISGTDIFTKDKEYQNTENRIKEILIRMTLDEKIGQMTQINLDVIGKGKDIYTSFLPYEFDEDMFESVMGKYKVGSILNTASVTAMSLDDWERIIARLQKKAIKETGIPIIYGIDAIHGATYTIGATLLPQAITMGATFNRQLVYESAKICAYETKASNIPWNFSPILDLGRDPRWPRQWETYGEDSYLISEMGKEMTRGYQGEGSDIGKDHVAACLKHYLGYSVPASGKDRTPAIISEHELREKHFYPFAQSIKEGALSVMLNSATINGVPVHANKTFVTQWLKEELNWDGVVVTDWADIDNIWLRDKVAETRKDAIRMSINAGVDMAMVPNDCSYCDLLRELVNEGLVSEERIDDAVARILRLKFRLDLFEKPYWSHTEYPDFSSTKFKQTSYDAASEGITLLKNKNNILPLHRDTKILVCGPNANSMRTLNGGWSYSWQGNKVDSLMPDGTTILKGICDRFGEKNIKYVPGVTYSMNGKYWEENEPDIEAAVKAASDIDYIILCLGENSYCETPGNLDDLYLSENQQQLVKALSKTGKPIILILNEGRPRIISKIEPLAEAVIQTFLPGSEGGKALADILIGEVNPSGKLPYTYPKYPNALTTYDHKPAESMDKMQGVYDYDAIVSVQWAFGYGLSYTTYEYSNLRIDKTSFGADDVIRINIDVKNTGQMGGKESVLLFVNDMVASITPDVRRLRKFDKVSLNPGEIKTVSFSLLAKELAFVNLSGKYMIEAGDFNVQIGSLAKTIKCTENHEYK
ncbi:glycoside hydrolase family 3 N-terminal domain-containing protein [uncultured Dysgonomonas sp.]|uniref:beta-glucosidase n=1 Tax=uncultured Dysgonomonas sp. TaxID=206096 RepID=A0A212K579_9BACT|nr:glycoside hydrolase family 3 N-terminal domain-containing protein [uncultured Dysgonomonas sp.]SBW06861.1 Beta-glucosidase BoGH3B [uncultured Dysgonomonas sp.]